MMSYEEYWKSFQVGFGHTFAVKDYFGLNIYICAASGLAGNSAVFGVVWDFFGVPAPGAEIRIFYDFRRRGHVKYSVLGLPGLNKARLLKP